LFEDFNKLTLKHDFTEKKMQKWPGKISLKFDFSSSFLLEYEHYAAFTLNDFDKQERNLTFVKTAFQVLK